MKSVIQDLRYAGRTLWKSPGFTLVAIFSLGLGIGLNTAIFSFVNVILIRPLPVIKEQDRLVWLRAPISYPDYNDYRSLSQSFDGMVAITGTSDFSIDRGGEPELVKGEYVTENYFEVLRVAAVKGRTFVAQEGQIPTPVMVLSEHLWRTRFNSDPNIIGKQISLNGIAFTVIGITPTGFIGTEVGLDRELWVPLAMSATLNPPDTTRAADPIKNRLENRNSHSLAVFARLKPGVTLEQADKDLTTLARNVAEAYSGKVSAETLRSVQLLRMSGGMDPRDQQEALPLAGIAMGVVGIVLLIACLNIASLLVARAAIRQRETAIRQALGASRPRLIRQWLTESVVLGIAGGTVGLLLGLWSNQLLISYLQATPLASLNLKLDWHVLAFTFAVSIITGIVFGLAPALQASRLDLVTALKSERVFLRGRHSSRLRTLFVTAQVALSVVLLIGAGLFLRALQTATTIDPGINVDRVLTVPLNLGLLRYKETDGQNFYSNLLSRVAAQPGVESVSIVRFPQLGFSFAQFEVFTEDRNNGQPDEGVSTGFNVVGPGYFTTMQTPLLRGRDFTEADRQGAPGVVVINATLASMLWNGADPLGKRISLTGQKGPFLEIVGVTRDGKYRSLGESPQPYVYQPVFQSYDPKMTMVIRTTGEPLSVTAAVREQIRILDPNLPVSDIKTLRDQLNFSLFPSRIAALTLGGFGVLALILAAIGIYGVVSYAVARRTHEIGIRIALGAKELSVLRLVIREGLFVVAVGLVVGLSLALVTTRLIEGFLYGVAATDAITFLTVPIVLGVVAVLASYLPARRATKVDPLVALRYE
ncbi:MAG TPA: ABC transporter permease [Pyrinomonadaceae bacterium]|jgi:predicted permease|nr:ABC transporter permease [Pyrinomonadaceae bacterium]